MLQEIYDNLVRSPWGEGSSHRTSDKARVEILHGIYKTIRFNCSYQRKREGKTQGGREGGREERKRSIFLSPRSKPRLGRFTLSYLVREFFLAHRWSRPVLFVHGRQELSRISTLRP